MIEYAERLIWALAIAGVTSCGGHRPPNPLPTPTPTPAPTPTPGGLPPVGTPVGPERLLRAEGDQHFKTNDGKRFDPFMAIPCCMGWAKIVNQLWPLASEQFMDETHKYGANTFHFRFGPWTAQPGVDDENDWDAIGGPYLPNSLEWNTVFWSKARGLSWHAYEQGSYAEVVNIDTWDLKHCAWGDITCAWTPEQVVIGSSLSSEQERLVRKVVKELGCFGNVVWTTGNEEDEAPGMNASWLNHYIDVVRDEEQKSGCGFVHMIGSGSFMAGVNSDYQITHAKSAVTGPCNGKLCVNNEHNPEFSAEQEASYFKQARDAGQVYAAWRAGASDDDWVDRLQRFKAVVDGGGTPVGCYAPDADDPAWSQPPIEPAARPAQMMAALNAAKASVGNRCGATGVNSEGVATIHQGCLDTNGLIAAELRKQGYCASGPWTDATAIKAPDGAYEEMHVCAYGDGCYTGNPYKYAWRYGGTAPTEPPPAADGCSDPEPPALYSFSGPTLHGTWYDATPVVNDHAYCEAIGLGTMPDGVTPRAQCPPRSECPGLKCEERPACERQIMGGLATWRSDGVVIVNQANENHLQARCTDCTWIGVCNAAGNVCKDPAVVP